MAQIKKTSVEQAPVVNAENQTAPESTTPQSENVANENKQDEVPSKPAPVADEPTSEKLIEIRAKIDESLMAIATETDRKKKLDIVLELQKLQASEQTELNAIKKAKIDAEIAEKRNARIALIDAAIDAAIAANKTAFDDSVSMEDKQALAETAKNAREKVVNELLAKFPSSAPSSSAATGSTAAGGSKGDTAKKIIERYEAHLAEGKNDTDARKAVIAEGYSRGTTGAVVLAYRKEKGLVD